MNRCDSIAEESPKVRGRAVEIDPIQQREQFGHGDWRSFQADLLVTDCIKENRWSLIEQSQQKFVRMHSDDAVYPKNGCWKIFQIPSNNDFGATCDRGGENMPIVWIGEKQFLDERFVAGDDALLGILVHGIANSTQICDG